MHAKNKNFFLAAFGVLLIICSSGTVKKIDNNINSSGDLFNALYVATDGNDSNAGTKDKPFASIKKAVDSLSPCGIILVRGGEYNLSATIILIKNGNKEKLNKLLAYPDEIPILNFSSMPISQSSINNNGIYLFADYWQIKGLTIKYSKNTGLIVCGSNNLVENISSSNNFRKGIEITSGKYQNFASTPSNNLIFNCDTYMNYNPNTFGEDGDGLTASAQIGTGNIFKKCRTWNNADDGLDLYNASNSVLVEECYSFANGYDLWNVGKMKFKGNGAGFKFPFHKASHIIRKCISWNNSKHGFAIYCDKESTMKVIYQNNISLNNKDGNFSFDNFNIKHELTNNISYYNPEFKTMMKNQNNYKDKIGPAAIQINNSWNLMINVLENDFLSFDYFGYRVLLKPGSEPEKYKIDPDVIKRKSDGTLQDTLFLKLAKGSKLIDSGSDIGLEYNGNAPDLGPFESNY